MGNCECDCSNSILLSHITHYCKTFNNSSGTELQCKLPNEKNLLNVLNQHWIEIPFALRPNLSKIVISFVCALDMYRFLSKKLSINYLISHLNITSNFEYYIEKHRTTKAYVIINDMNNNNNKMIIIEKPDMKENFYYSQNIENTCNLPLKYKQFMIQKMMRIKKRNLEIDENQKLFIPEHVMWWKNIEDGFKAYFANTFKCAFVSDFIYCKGVGDLRSYGIIHNCVSAPLLYDTCEPMYFEFFAVCTNIQAHANANAFPRFILNDKLVFEMKAVTYSSCKYLGLHMPLNWE